MVSYCSRKGNIVIDRDIFERVVRRIDSYRDEMIQLQIDLTAIPALSPDSGGDGEFKKSRFIIDYLTKHGFTDIREFNAPDERVTAGVRPNVVTTLPGGNPDKTVWLLSHMDIVPPGEPGLWHSDPYKGYVKDGKIFGRGMEDNQQDLVSSIFAARALMDEGVTPASTVGLVFVADEETGSTMGLGHLIENHATLFSQTDLIIVPDFGNTDGSVIEIAEKSILWLRLVTKGTQCHASRPALGKNAFVAASHFVVKLGELRDLFDATDPIYRPPESTFEPTKKETNIPNINTIPGEDVFYLDCRILPQYELADVISAIRTLANEIERQFGVTIDVTPVQQVQAPAPTPADADVVQALRDAVKEIYDVTAEPIGIGGGTVAACFREKGFPVAVWSRLCEMAHQPNEYCLIDNMIGNAKVFAHLFLQQ